MSWADTSKARPDGLPLGTIEWDPSFKPRKYGFKDEQRRLVKVDCWGERWPFARIIIIGRISVKTGPIPKISHLGTWKYNQ